MAVTWGQALDWRLRRQLLHPEGTVTVGAVVSRLGAVAAYPDSTPELAVGMRRAGSRAGDVGRALDAGEIFKTFAFRGATHLLTPEEGGAYLALRASGRQWELPSWQETYGLAPSDWPAFRETVRKAVAAGPLTRRELSAAVARQPPFRLAAAGLISNSYTLLKPLMSQGDLCFGPMQDGETTVQSMDDVPRWSGLPNIDDAGRWAIEAYLRTYGPANVDAVQYYLGAGLSAGRKALLGWLDDLSDGLVTIDIEGEQLLLFADDLDDLCSTEPSPTIRLLPGGDPWVMGPGTANPHVVPPAHRQVVTRGANLVLVDGTVSGTWTRKAGTLTVGWLNSAKSPDLDLLADEVSRLGVVLDAELNVNVVTDD